MKAVWYILTIICGVIGLGTLLRFVEVLLFGGGMSPFQLLFGVVLLVVAWQCLLKARHT
jgi:hypothetical protein